MSEFIDGQGDFFAMTYFYLCKLKYF